MKKKTTRIHQYDNKKMDGRGTESIEYSYLLIFKMKESRIFLTLFFSMYFNWSFNLLMNSEEKE